MPLKTTTRLQTLPATPSVGKAISSLVTPLIGGRNEVKASGATQDDHSPTDAPGDSLVTSVGKAITSLVSPLIGGRSEAKASNADSDGDSDELPGTSLVPLVSARKPAARGSSSRSVAQRNSTFFGPTHPDGTPDFAAYEEAKRQGKMVVNGEEYFFTGSQSMTMDMTPAQQRKLAKLLEERR